MQLPRSTRPTAVVLDGCEVLGRLAALVPPPRVHMIRYFGVLASRARLREEVVPKKTESAACEHEGGASSSASPAPSDGSAQPRRLKWAQLMARVFDIDVLQCDRRGQKGMQQVAFITQPSVIKAMLKSVGLATATPERKRASLPEQAQGELGATRPARSSRHPSPAIIR